MTLQKRIVASAVAVLAIVSLVLIFEHPILFAFGQFLTSAGPPVKCDMVVVIGGDFFGNRVMKGAELVREGFAPMVLISGSGDIYGHFESDLAVAFAVERGYPASSFYASHVAELNTVGEAHDDLAELRRRGVHSYIVVTSPFHTARASRILRREAPDLELHMVAAPDPYWNNGEWWTSREGQKEWFFESVKTLADFVRL